MVIALQSLQGDARSLTPHNMPAVKLAATDRGERPLVSLCIPSFNRPELLARLLDSIDADPQLVEVLIAEDYAPRRFEVRAVAERFREDATYTVTYCENRENVGYDRNLRVLLERARGEFVIFMGDDDLFVPGALDEYLAFLLCNRDVGYVLRSYVAEYPGRSRELFRYFATSRRFAPGYETAALLFRRSVSLAGFTVRRDLAVDLATDTFDGTLLYQLYLVAEVAMHHPTAFCDIPFVFAEQTFRTDSAFFGNASAEEGSFSPGAVVPSNSLNFMRGFFRITVFIDAKYGLHLTERVRIDLSKYSYPILAIQRKRGLRVFLRYAIALHREIGLGITIYFYLYTFGLAVVGEDRCDAAIRGFKRILGRTPQL